LSTDGGDSAESISEDPPDYTFLRPPDGGPPQLGDYEVGEVLGKGGMGFVFIGKDRKLDRRVALKVMRPEIAAKANSRQRFLREARLVAALHHDNIVPIYHVGEQDGVPFFAMPMLKGEALADRVDREKVLPTADVIHIGRDALAGLAAAHERGLIHRDIKPRNLWLETMPSE